MTPADGLEYLEKQIVARIASFKDSRRFYRGGSLFQTIATAALGALTALTIGLNQIYKGHGLAAVSLGLAALTTISAAATGWFSFQKRWISSQRTLNHLYQLRSDIAYQRASDPTKLEQSAVDGYHARYQAILDAANAEWEAARSSGQ